MLPDEKDEEIHLRSMLYPIKNAKLVFKKQWAGYMHNRDLNKLQYIELQSDFTDYALISEKILTLVIYYLLRSQNSPYLFVIGISPQKR